MQTPSRVGEPWVKVTSLGTNMKQIVSAPDGTPTSDFTGRPRYDDHRYIMPTTDLQHSFSINYASPHHWLTSTGPIQRPMCDARNHGAKNLPKHLM